MKPFETVRINSQTSRAVGKWYFSETGRLQLVHAVRKSFDPLCDMVPIIQELSKWIVLAKSKIALVHLQRTQQAILQTNPNTSSTSAIERATEIQREKILIRANQSTLMKFAELQQRIQVLMDSFIPKATAPSSAIASMNPASSSSNPPQQTPSASPSSVQWTAQAQLHMDSSADAAALLIVNQLDPVMEKLKDQLNLFNQQIEQLKAHKPQNMADSKSSSAPPAQSYSAHVFSTSSSSLLPSLSNTGPSANAIAVSGGSGTTASAQTNAVPDFKRVVVHMYFPHSKEATVAATDLSSNTRFGQRQPSVADLFAKSMKQLLYELSPVIGGGNTDLMSSVLFLCSGTADAEPRIVDPISSTMQSFAGVTTDQLRKFYRHDRKAGAATTLLDFQRYHPSLLIVPTYGTASHLQTQLNQSDESKFNQLEYVRKHASIVEMLRASQPERAFYPNTAILRELIQEKRWTNYSLIIIPYVQNESGLWQTLFQQQCHGTILESLVQQLMNDIAQSAVRKPVMGTWMVKNAYI
jgi:hypothetical protein